MSRGFTTDYMRDWQQLIENNVAREEEEEEEKVGQPVEEETDQLSCDSVTIAAAGGVEDKRPRRLHRRGLKAGVKYIYTVKIAFTARYFPLLFQGLFHAISGEKICSLIYRGISPSISGYTFYLYLYRGNLS